MGDMFGIGVRIMNSVHEHARNARGSGRSYVLSDMLQGGDCVVFANEDDVGEFRAIQERRGRITMFRPIVVSPEYGVVGVSAVLGDRKFKRLLFDHNWLEEYYALEVSRVTRNISVIASQFSEETL